MGVAFKERYPLLIDGKAGPETGSVRDTHTAERAGGQVDTHDMCVRRRRTCEEESRFAAGRTDFEDRLRLPSAHQLDELDQFTFDLDKRVEVKSQPVERADEPKFGRERMTAAPTQPGGN